jgi:hypothetical protein
MLPAYLMEQLARYQGEEIRRQAERVRFRSSEGDSIHRRSSRLRLRRLRFKLRRTDPPVEIDLRDSGSVGEPSGKIGVPHSKPIAPTVRPRASGEPASVRAIDVYDPVGPHDRNAWTRRITPSQSRRIGSGDHDRSPVPGTDA